MQGEGNSMANKPQTHPGHDTSSTAAHPENAGLGGADPPQHTHRDPEQRWESTARPEQPRHWGG